MIPATLARNEVRSLIDMMGVLTLIDGFAERGILRFIEMPVETIDPHAVGSDRRKTLFDVFGP